MGRTAAALVLSGRLLVVILLSAAVLPGSVAAQPPIRIGASLSQIGNYAALGQNQLRGYRLCIKHLNDKGGVLGRKLQLIVEDDQSQAPNAVRIYEKLIAEERVDAILGPYSSPITEAVADVSEKHRMPVVAAGAATTSIFKKGRKHVFRLFSPAEVYLEGLIDLGARRGLNTVAVIHEKVKEERDSAGRGRPDTVAHYEDAQLVRLEEDPRGTGRTTRWSYFRDKELVRREEDRNGDGKPDLWVHFERGKRVKQEEDPQFRGRATIVYHFKDDELVTSEESTTGDGRFDLVSHYEGGVLVHQEARTNCAGNADVWIYYANGQKARQEDATATGRLTFASSSRRGSSPVRRSWAGRPRAPCPSRLPRHPIYTLERWPHVDCRLDPLRMDMLRASSLSRVRARRQALRAPIRPDPARPGARSRGAGLHRRGEPLLTGGHQRSELRGRVPTRGQ